MGKLQSLEYHSLLQEASPFELRKYSSEAIIESPVKTTKSKKQERHSKALGHSQRKIKLNQSTHLNDSRLS